MQIRNLLKLENGRAKTRSKNNLLFDFEFLWIRKGGVSFQTGAEATKKAKKKNKGWKNETMKEHEKMKERKMKKHNQREIKRDGE